MQIISYSFYYSKAYSDHFTISKDIDAENLIIIFFDNLCIMYIFLWIKQIFFACPFFF